MLLGFDIGGTKCAVVIGEKGSEQIKILDKLIMSTNQPTYEIIEKLFSAAEDLLKKHFVTNDEI